MAAEGPTGSSGNKYQIPEPLRLSLPAATLLVNVVKGEVSQNVDGCHEQEQGRIRFVSLLYT